MAVININQFGDGQKAEIYKGIAQFLEQLTRTAPQLAGHFLSGGFLEIKTMSGAHLKVGFSPQPGGLVLPGGIAPVPRNGGLIK